MNIISLFSGCGGLDLGFSKAGFNVVWANEYDRSIWETYQFNHSKTKLDKRDIRNIKNYEIPDCIGIIGGPPCQSWSEAGAGRGINDTRGQLFHDYIRIVEAKQPLFFLAENVKGILANKHTQAFANILNQFKNLGYEVSYQLLNANDFNVPQDRQRVIIVGYHEQLGGTFKFPRNTNPDGQFLSGRQSLQRGEPPQRAALGTPLQNCPCLSLKDAIYNLRQFEPIKVKDKIKNLNNIVSNHEYLDTSFSSIYMSRNRVRNWSEPSFTIQAGGRHAPIHPQANKMIFVEKDKRIFDPNSPLPYRRLSVRECARIQTFPDNFIFKYDYIAHGYKMVGNAVPVNFACIIGEQIYKDIKEYLATVSCGNLRDTNLAKQLTLLTPD